MTIVMQISAIIAMWIFIYISIVSFSIAKKQQHCNQTLIEKIEELLAEVKQLKIRCDK